ncbi:TerD family protein [Deinococcus misasensis]|uniref:TerD family protein n=1 Tax=Deinococcus misasensis TaxID=392413 RepID=UPI00054E3CBF|nr:TerD family protein [Deinococcus misasensis]
MAIQLQKGGNINLSKEAPNLRKARVGLGWDPRVTEGTEFDLDAMALLVGTNNRARGDADLVFYNNLSHQSGSVEHTGDNRSGVGDGDDESLVIELAKVPSYVDKIIISVSIHDARERFQNFGQVQNAFIRVVNEETDAEIVRYDLTEDASTETLMVFGEIYRYGTEWKFRAVGQGYREGLVAFLRNHGFNV